VRVKRLDLGGLHVDTVSGTSVVILREHEAPFRVVPIAVGGAEAASLAVALSGQPPPRPLAHDLMAALVEGIGAVVDRIEVTALRDGMFLAEVAVLGPRGLQRLDARPSDGIALAARVGAPLYVDEAVLDVAGRILPEVPEDRADDEAVDRAVDEFRDLLDRLDPAALAAALGDRLDERGPGTPGSPTDPDVDPGPSDDE
jgi:uncharacterized protein